MDRYKRSIAELFEVPSFRGLASGEATTSAYFFVAASEDSLFFLDPHIAVQTHPASRFFQDKVLRIPWSRLNASMTLGFLVASERELDALLAKLKVIDEDLFETLPSRAPFKERITEADDELLLIN